MSRIPLMAPENDLQVTERQNVVMLEVRFKDKCKLSFNIKVLV